LVEELPTDDGDFGGGLDAEADGAAADGGDVDDDVEAGKDDLFSQPARKD
jgi:hypothetical protein